MYRHTQFGTLTVVSVGAAIVVLVLITTTTQWHFVSIGVLAILVILLLLFYSLTVTIDRSDLEIVIMGQKRLKTMIEDGTAKAVGDASLLDKLAASLGTFTPDFEMVPGTKGQAPRQDLNPYEIGTVDMQHE